MVVDLTQERVISSVISQPTSATRKLNAIVKIRKYRRLHEGHHFISMAMEVHGALRHDMDRFIKEYARLFFTIDNQEIIYLCPFRFSFLNNKLILLFNVL